MVFIQILPQHLDILRVVTALFVNRDTVFLNWGVGFGSTRRKTQDNKISKRPTIAYRNIVLDCRSIVWFLLISDSSPIYTKNRVNTEQNGNNITPYWIFLREYCLPIKSINGRNDTYTLKWCDQEGHVATVRFTTCLPFRTSFDTSDRVRTSRHISLTVIIDSDKLPNMSNTSWTYRNIRFFGGARDTPSPPSAPFVLSYRDPSA